MMVGPEVSVLQALKVSMHANSLQLCLSFGTPGTVAPFQDPLSMGILQARVLEWVAMPFSRRSSQAGDGTHVSSVSCFGRQVLYH